MRWQPITVRLKQSVTASPPYDVVLLTVQPGQRVRVRWLACGMSGASTYTAQPSVINPAGTYGLSVSITANNGNITAVLCDFWVNEGDTLTFHFLTNNTAGTCTAVMSGELWTADYALPGPLQQ